MKWVYSDKTLKVLIPMLRTHVELCSPSFSADVAYGISGFAGNPFNSKQ